MGVKTKLTCGLTNVNMFIYKVLSAFQFEQAVNVDPIGDYTIKDGIEVFIFKGKNELILK